jgi:ppGpp synthetase/RelA/SpoT-type nucleotidyltranferase
MGAGSVTSAAARSMDGCFANLRSKTVATKHFTRPRTRRYSLRNMVYASPAYARETFNAAGNALIGKDLQGLGVEQSLGIINNWRASHAFPLNALHVTLRGRAKKVDANALTAQRLKRLSSIEAKLRRFPDMKLTQMQDIGGCRAVVKDVSEVERLIAAYRKGVAKNPKKRHVFLSEKDYITSPKADGYRSFHLIYRYHSRARKHSVYSGLKIEIQVRTKLQHAWATAVEIISTFTGQALKSNMGDECWRRFFKLMSSEIALRERRPHVPDTPTDRTELVRELRELVEKLQVQTALTGWGTGVKVISEREKSAHTYLLILDSKKRNITHIGFTKHELPEAQRQYLAAETKNADKPWIQAVLVSVDSVSALRRAYPNYYLDSIAFSQAVSRAIDSKP